MSPLDENHQALLIRPYRMAGDGDAAAKQFVAFTKTLGAELGVAPGPAVQAAMRKTRHALDEVADGVTIEAIVEAGSAAVSAGAVEAEVRSGGGPMPSPGGRRTSVSSLPWLVARRQLWSAGVRS
jgi:DNA-binding SARP family transcriptional activator